MKSVRILALLFICWLLFLTGCYTSFKHPVKTSDGQRIDTSDIYIIDNCSDCHQATQFSSGTILPEAAQDDYDWQFFTKSTWWQDSFDFYPVNSGENPESTMPRNRQGHYNDQSLIPAPMPVPEPVPGSLGKKPADTESNETEQKDNRRDFIRRQQADKDSDNSSGNSRSSNRKR